MKLVIIGASGHYPFALEALKLRPSLELVGIAPGRPDEDMSHLQAQTDALHYADWRTMLDKEKPDLAVVNSWFGDNADISIECLQKGMHVFCEKPLATELDKLDELTDVWRTSGQALGGMFNLRYCGWFLTVRQAIDDGLIGQVRQLHGQKSYKLGVRGQVYQHRRDYGGIIPWVGIHALDWVLQLGGLCESIIGLQSDRCNQGNGELEMTSALLAQLSGGVIGTVTADFLRPTGAPRHDDDRLRVTGTRGMLEALNGQVFLEDDQPRRQLPTLPGQNCLITMLDAIGTPAGTKRTLDDLAVTRAALMARDSVLH